MTLPNRPRAALLAAALIAALLALPSAALAQEPATGRYIVVYEDGASAGVKAETDARERSLGFKTRFRYRHALEGFAATLSPEQVRELRADPEVASVTRDKPVSALASVPLAPGEPEPPTGAQRVGASTTTTVREPASTSVAVIDSGIDLDHPDLNVVDGTDCIDGGPAEDLDGHGTHVAGIVGAENNGTGVTGVAPGTEVVAVRVLNENGDGSASSVICGINWVAANKDAFSIEVANMSLGGGSGGFLPCGTPGDDPEHIAICNLTENEVLPVAAAGNGTVDFGGFPLTVPAAFPEVLAVTAMSDGNGAPGGGTPPPLFCGEADDAFATFSNFATRDADRQHTVAAPGVCIESTVPDDDYDTFSGTSMASPHVAALAALCIGGASGAGPCAGMAPAHMLQRLRADAEAYTRATPGYGFEGDPVRPVPNRFFGPLVRADIATPTARTGDAPTQSHESATITAAVGPVGEPTLYRFEYGTSDAYGSSTPDRVTAAVFPEQGATELLSGLAPLTTYHYRVVATNAFGTARGADRTFTTGAVPGPPPPPPPPPPGVDLTAPIARLSVTSQRLRTVQGRGLRASLACSEPCGVSADILLSSTLSRRLGLRRRGSAVIGRLRTALGDTARKRITVRLFGRAARKLDRVRSASVKLRVRLTDGVGNTRVVSRRVSLTR
jgi:subtilisin family serine protease